MDDLFTTACILLFISAGICMPFLIKDLCKINNLVGFGDWLTPLIVTVIRFVSMSIIVGVIIVFVFYLLGIVEIKKIDKHDK